MTKADDPRLVAISEAVRVAARGRPSWSKGQTKDTNPILATIARKVSIAQRGRAVGPAARAALAAGRFSAKGRTKATCSIIAARGAKSGQTRRGRPNPGQSERLKKRHAEHPELHPNAILAKKTKGKGFTHIERCVAEHLDALGVEYGYNVRVGTKWPDFSIKSHGLLVEADGAYWHQDTAKEAERDAYLESLGWRVLHLPGAFIINEPAQCRTAIETALEAHRGAR